MNARAFAPHTPPIRHSRDWHARHRLLAVPLTVLALLCLAAPAQAYIYWAGNEAPLAIGRANDDGTGVIKDFIRQASSSFGIALSGTHIYWVNQAAPGCLETELFLCPNTGSIGRANLNGTDVDQNFIVGADDPLGVAVNGQGIYWTNHGSYTIGHANLDGTNVDQGFIAAAGDPIGIAVHGTHVYWSVSGGEGEINRANLDGTAVTRGLITASEPFGVAVDGAHVYWANLGSYEIGRASLDGTNVDQSFIQGIVEGPSALAVDSAHIYWNGDAEDSVAGIARANLDGTGANPYFIRRVLVSALAVDALGPAGCAVPKLTGWTLAAAKTALKRAHCAVGKVTKRKSSTVSTGRVISSSPKAGSKHRAGTKVALTVSRGKHRAGRPPAACSNETVNGVAGKLTLRFVLHGKVSCNKAHSLIRAYFRHVATGYCRNRGTACSFSFAGGWDCALHVVGEHDGVAGCGHDLAPFATVTVYRVTRRASTAADPSSFTIAGVAVTSANNAWSVGFSYSEKRNSRDRSNFKAVILHWNGTKWT